MKRNSLIKRIAVGIMAFSLIIPAVPAGAQITYNPLSQGNHGIVIDTSRVPNDNNIKVTSNGIEARKNVQFQLDCSVDADWTIAAASQNDAVALAEANNRVTVDPNSGLVRIDPAARTANYTITASAYNVEEANAARINLKVRGDENAAIATSVKLDKDAMDVPGRVEVSNDGKTVTLTGRVQAVPLQVIYEPDYLVDNTVFYTNQATEVYGLAGANNQLISSRKAKTDSVRLNCTVGVNNATMVNETFNVKVNGESYTQRLITDDIEMTSTINRTYGLKMNQDVLFYVEENTATALPIVGIRNVTWSIAQNNVPLVGAPVDTDGDDIDDTTRYIIRDVQGNQQGIIDIPDIVDDAPAGTLRTIRVLTNVATTTNNIQAISISGLTKFADDTEAAISPIVLNFNGNAQAGFAKVGLDFSRAPGMVEETNYVIQEETIEGKKENVYYFESGGSNLDLVSATFADVSGVRNFEASKDTAFGVLGTTNYTVSYEMSNLLFGSDSLNASYNNRLLDNANNPAEFDGQNCLINGSIFTKVGTGYKKLTVTCSAGSKRISQESYIIRFVTPSTNLRDFGLAIDKNATQWYTADANRDIVDTIHIRQGEAIVPGVFVNTIRDRDSKDPNMVTIYNPYLEFEFDQEGIASATVSTANDSKGLYRVNGLTPGRVIVTLRGKVNKNASRSFVLYVNEDIYDTDFLINFDDAKAGGVMNENFVINGKYSSIPIGLTSTSASGGIPKVTWSLNCDAAYAEINPTTGVLTTKQSTKSGQKIVVTAESASGKKDQAEFTIAEVQGTSIKTIEETSATSLVEVSDVNAGTCKAGDTFTLYAASYVPENATVLSGEIVWSSDNKQVADIDASTGRVTAYSAGTTRITASYQPGDGRDAVETQYVLSVTGIANPITGINVNKTITLSRIGVSQSLDAKPYPEDATDGRLKYESSDPSIATVDAAGQVTAIAVGECTVTITSVANSSITETVKVVVSGNPDTPIKGEEVDNVEKLISAIGTVTADDASKAKIDAARAAYDKLTEAQKATISADVVKVLTTAETTYTTAKKAADDKAAADKKAAEEKAAAEKAAAEKAAAEKAAAEKAAAEKAALEAAQSIQTKTTKVKTAKNNKGKKVKVGFAKVEGANGYQVRYSLKKNMKSSKSKVVTGTSATLTKLKKKTYYIQVRAFSEYNGTKYYTKWSAKKPVKVKK